MWRRKSFCINLLMWSFFFLTSGVEKTTGPATPAGDFGITPEQLVIMSKDHNSGALEQYGGVSFQS